MKGIGKSISKIASDLGLSVSETEHYLSCNLVHFDIATGKYYLEDTFITLE